MKDNKGITLVVLVVTIILLLILAGVSIGISLNSKLIKGAKDSVKTFETEELEQNKTMQSQIDKIENYKEEDNNTRKWYELTTSERKLCKEDKYGDLIIAAEGEDNEPAHMGAGFLLYTDEKNYLIIQHKKSEDITISINYYYVFNDEFAKQFNIEKEKWYTNINKSTLKEYTGKSPIQFSSFPSGEIYCSSYLSRVIASFNS